MGGVGVEEGGFWQCRATSEEGRVGINRVDLGPDRQAVFKRRCTSRWFRNRISTLRLAK